MKYGPRVPFAAMPFQPLLAILVLAGAGATNTAANAGTKQFPFEFDLPLPLPLEGQRLRRLGPPGLDSPFAAFGAMPLKVISIDMPQDVEMLRGSPVADGPLRDLLNLGSAMGAAVLSPVDMPFAAHRNSGLSDSLELPLNALHLRMREHVPAPLNIDDADGKIHIYGTLPKSLTPKTLKVSLSGDEERNLLVKYFLGQESGSKSIVGIDEHFALDFAPVDAPVVTYKASTGAFDLVLKRPAVEPRKDVAIDFSAAPVKANRLRAMKPEHLAMTKPSHVNNVAVAAQSVDAANRMASEVALRHFRAQASQPRTDRRQASPKEFVHRAKLARLPASPVKSAAVDNVAHEMKRMARELPKVVQGSTSKAERVKKVSDRAKQFVADAHLDDATKELTNAFAPLDLGLVMLEMNHGVRAH